MSKQSFSQQETVNRTLLTPLTLAFAGLQSDTHEHERREDTT